MSRQSLTRCSVYCGSFLLWIAWASSLASAIELSQEREWRIPDGNVMSVTFTHDSRKLVISAGGRDSGKVLVYDVASGALLGSVVGHSSYVHESSVAPDDKVVASAGADCTIRVCSLEKYEELYRLDRHDSRVYSVSFSKSGQSLVSSSKDGRIALWDVEKRAQRKTFDGHQGAVNSVRFSEDDKFVISAGNDETVKVWDVESGKIVRTINPECSFCRSLSCHGGRVAVGGFGDRLTVWEVHSGRNTFSTDLSDPRFTSPTSHCIAVSRGRGIQIWDFQDNSTFQIEKAHDNLFLH